MPFEYIVVQQGTRGELERDVAALLNDNPSPGAEPWQLVGGVSIAVAMSQVPEKELQRVDQWAQALTRFRR